MTLLNQWFKNHITQLNEQISNCESWEKESIKLQIQEAEMQLNEVRRLESIVNSLSEDDSEDWQFTEED